TSATLDITNFDTVTGPGSTPLVFTVTGLTVDFENGTSEVLPASDFTTDSDGDEDCTAAACDFSSSSSPVVSATLTGTISPTTGLTGLDPGDTGITGAMSDATGDAFVTITPGCGLTDPGSGTPILDNGSTGDGCQDTALIYAVETSGVVATPEPGTWSLLGIGLIGLLIGCRRFRGAGRFSATAA
ncbi:MAG: PEP-CTERM sorting domain-containing protein, partial [Isosphaeraceae bacterium]